MSRGRAGSSALDTAQRILATCDLVAEIELGGVDAFRSDFRVQWAVGMGFVRLGEDASRLPDSVRERFTGQPWGKIIGLRNVAAHQYDELSPRLAWKTVERDIPALREYLRDVMIPALQRDDGGRLSSAETRPPKSGR